MEIEEKSPSYFIVRYGRMRFRNLFSTTHPKIKYGSWCVIRSPRGVEIGEVISHSLTQEELPNEPAEQAGEILRELAREDLEKIEGIEEDTEPKEYRYCLEKIREHNLPMKLVNVEHLFGGSKIIFYFLADGRVDFRDLVKDLTKEYRTRIEMKQIGVRDEARLLADFEHCGREICCRTFMKELEPVTMKMAKNQKTTLDPAKISGRCGRLMCCLRFEDETYNFLKGNLPRKGKRIETFRGRGEVVGYDILKQRVQIELEGGDLVEIPFQEIQRDSEEDGEKDSEE